MLLTLKGTKTGIESLFYYPNKDIKKANNTLCIIPVIIIYKQYYTRTGATNPNGCYILHNLIVYNIIVRITLSTN